MGCFNSKHAQMAAAAYAGHKNKSPGKGLAKAFGGIFEGDEEGAFEGGLGDFVEGAADAGFDFDFDGGDCGA